MKALGIIIGIALSGAVWAHDNGQYGNDPKLKAWFNIPGAGA